MTINIREKTYTSVTIPPEKDNKKTSFDPFNKLPPQRTSQKPIQYFNINSLKHGSNICNVIVKISKITDLEDKLNIVVSVINKKHIITSSKEIELHRSNLDKSELQLAILEYKKDNKGSNDVPIFCYSMHQFMHSGPEKSLVDRIKYQLKSQKKYSLGISFINLVGTINVGGPVELNLIRFNKENAILSELKKLNTNGKSFIIRRIVIEYFKNSRAFPVLTKFPVSAKSPEPKKDKKPQRNRKILKN